MAVTQEEEQVSLKLLVNKETKKVILAEAGKDFVDVLFSFLTMPLGTIARVVQKESHMGPVRVGCLSSLYESVTNLDKCLWTDTCKEMLLRPRNSLVDYCMSLKLNIDDTEPTKHFICKKLRCSHEVLSTFQNEICRCGNLMAYSVLVKSEKVYNGFVNDVATFIVTDDLVVIPNAVVASFDVLQNCGVKNLNSVLEMTVNVTKKKVLDLLKCSLLSKSTLTDLFLGKKPLIENSSFSPPVVENSGTIQIKVKLVMRKLDGKILFAQGEEDFVDLLFSFLTFPLGGVVRMLGGYSNLGSIDGLYKSIVGFNENKDLISKEVKDILVDPGLAPQFKLSKQMLPIYEQEAKYYCYYQRHRGFTESKYNDKFYITNEFRPYIGKNETYTFLELVDLKTSTGSLKGYVKGPAMFMVTDDLVVSPMSPILGLSLINRLKTPLNDLEEKDVTIGIKEGILIASLTSSSVLTNGLCHLLPKVIEHNVKNSIWTSDLIQYKAGLTLSSALSNGFSHLLPKVVEQSFENLTPTPTREIVKIQKRYGSHYVVVVVKMLAYCVKLFLLFS